MILKPSIMYKLKIIPASSCFPFSSDTNLFFCCCSPHFPLFFLFFYFFFFPLQVAPAAASSTESGHSDTSAFHSCFLVNEGIPASLFYLPFTPAKILSHCYFYLISKAVLL